MIEIGGLDIMIRGIDNSAENMDDKLEFVVKKISSKLLRNVKLKTPVAKSTPTHTGGQLRRSWKVVKNGKFEAIISNSTSYASYVEFGHRTRGNTVVDGRYMLKSSLEEIQESLEDELSCVFDNLF